jgi:hypothetical protein
MGERRVSLCFSHRDEDLIQASRRTAVGGVFDWSLITDKPEALLEPQFLTRNVFLEAQQPRVFFLSLASQHGALPLRPDCCSVSTLIQRGE